MVENNDMAVVAEMARASVGRQILRGIGFFLCGFTALLGAAVLVSWANDDGSGQVGLTRRLAAMAALLAMAGGIVLVWRRLRGWEARPSWLFPAVCALALAASVPAVYAPAPSASSAGACIPILQAWDPVAERPGADPVVEERNIYSKPVLGSRPQVVAQLVVSRAEPGTPQYQRDQVYSRWLDSDASCAPSSRTHLAWSAAGLGFGTAALTVAVRRRRR